MSDLVVVSAALAAAAGAWLAIPISPLVGAVAVVLSLGVGRTTAAGRSRRWRGPVLVLAIAALCAGLSARAEAGLVTSAAGPVEGAARLAEDPRPIGSGVAVIVMLHGRRWEAVAWGAPAGVLRRAQAGEQVLVAGRADGRRPGRWLLQRHVVGRLQVEHAEVGAPAPPVARAANRLRSLLARGARPLGSRAPLLLGLVVGDDRAQSQEMRDAFRSAGLSHLTAVSGQNVAFAMAVVAPVLVLLPLRARAVASVVLLGCFVVLTRAEPSVLRAATMAGLGAVHAVTGARRGGVRRLAMALSLLLVIDPLLVRSVGLWLSVLATGGIIVLAPLLAERLPGPRPLAMAVSITCGAQLATAPLLVAVFGSVPVMALPANLLAVPVAGPIMVWGITAGLLAGAVGGRLAAILHAPTALGLWWLEAVATWAAAQPVGALRTPHVVVLGGATLVGLRPGASRVAQRLALVVAALALVAAALGPVAGGPVAGGG